MTTAFIAFREDGLEETIYAASSHHPKFGSTTTVCPEDAEPFPTWDAAMEAARFHGPQWMVGEVTC